ncbi:hypothetical protein P879_08163 [Paragonimus westermani]|uniref:RING-type domain-containing protein n=1 Tax=Paragonimus westermani TaxID=34504 RepID=A0A8T0D6J2_9TREM|nr:hypothetical protein P879_08163 [Paragonimus westermani]
MSTSMINESRFNSRGRNKSGGSRTSSPGRGPRSEGGYSATLSQKSTDSKKKRSSTYPKKGSTLGNIDLSEEDQAHLNDVLERFDRFRQMEERRIRDLQSELVEKQKVRIRNAEASGDGHCYNCGRLFMAVFNTPIECHICRHEFCRMCLEKMPKSKDLICKFCRFESVTRGQTGVWFMEELKKARAAGRVRGVSGPEALRSSLMRIKRESRANSLMQQIANPLSDQDLDNSCSNESSHISIDESDSRSLEDEDFDIHPRAIRLSTASTYTHKAYSPVSIKPLTASTALCARSGKCCFDPDDPMELELTDLGDEVTPIRSTSKGLCSCESDMKTPDSAELSEHLNHSEMVLDPVGSEAEALLRAKRSFRRVRFLAALMRTKELPSPTEG